MELFWYINPQLKPELVLTDNHVGVEINLHRAKTMVLGEESGAYEKLVFDGEWNGVISPQLYKTSEKR